MPALFARRGVRAGVCALACVLAAVASLRPAPAAAQQPLDPNAYTSLGTLNVADGATITINTDTNTLSVSGGPTFTGVLQSQPQGSGGPNISVFDFSNVLIASGATISMTGSAPLAILSQGSLTENAPFLVPTGALGGAPGGAVETNGGGPGGGSFVSDPDPVEGDAAGGGFGGVGGQDAHYSEGGGPSYGNLQTALQGGSGGSGSGNIYSGTAGGGAVELVAAGTLSLAGGASVAGGSGPAGSSAGAGSGGGIILAGSTVAVVGAVSAAGGSGGANSSGSTSLGGGGGGGGRILVVPDSYTLGSLAANVAGGTGGYGTTFAGFNGAAGIAQIIPATSVINPSGRTQPLGNGSITDNGFTLSLNGLAISNSGTLTQDLGNAVSLGTLTNNSAGVVTLNGGTVTAATIANAGTFNVSRGTLSYTTFNQTAGGVTGDLYNEVGETFNYSGGSFAGNLTNNGTANINGAFTAGNGILNFGEMTVNAGAAANSNNVGLNNSGSLTLNGGSLGGAGVTNNASISGFGTITGSGPFINNLQVSVSGGNLTLASLPVTSVNYGEIDVGSGRLLILSGSALSNQGTLTLSSSGVSGDASMLTNDAGGLIAGHGTISAAFANNAGGTLLLGDTGNTNITSAFNNAGTIHLTNDAANLVGGKVANTGTIYGHGMLGSAIDNTGTISANGGTLQLNGAVSNLAGGTIESATGTEVLAAAGLAGLLGNDGTIALTGGTFDNGGKALTNVGAIQGQGTVATGGLSNNGSLSLANGTSNVLGSVTNNSSVQVQNATVTFFGTVTNTSRGTIAVNGSTVSYLGGLVNRGTLITDPTILETTDFTNNGSAAVVASAGDVYELQESLLGNTTNNTDWNTTAAKLDFIGGGGNAHTLDLYGLELGATTAGLTNNFAWGTLEVATGQSLTLADAKSGTGAMYVDSLLLDGFSRGSLADFIQSWITGDGYNIYYDPDAAGNGYLDGLDYALAGGGSLIALSAGPVPEPEPASLGLLFGAIALLAASRLRWA
ncbi:MAG TPA: hypothetical protein VGG99_18495 [Acetobacteraceae bacterium]